MATIFFAFDKILMCKLSLKTIVDQYSKTYNPDFMQTYILVVYANRNCSPLKKTVEESVYSFSAYSSHRFFFVNVAYKIPKYLLEVNFDLVIFTTSSLAYIQYPLTPIDRNPCYFNMQKLKEIDAIRITIPQDEFLNSAFLCQFIEEFNISTVFSVCSPSLWDQIYPSIDRKKVSFFHVLTGYLSDDISQIVNSLSNEVILRDIDIGYRAWKAEYWVGRHGMLKLQIAEKFLDHCANLPLKLDISTDQNSIFYGMDWYRFMLRCKSMIGVEGGSSILDFHGSIRKSINEYLKRNPRAPFEEVEEYCFPGLDGKLNVKALSPRHLEACATKTCQILLEGDYSGVLKPHLHYIELKKDFSNIDDAIKQMQDEKIRKEITERAYQDIVLSGKYSWKNFVNFVLDKSLSQAKLKPKTEKDGKIWFKQKRREYILEKILPFELRLRNIIKGSLSDPLWQKLKRVMKRC